MEVVTVPRARTWRLLRALPQRGIAGGATYNALIVACAREANVDVIVTWNLRDFERLADDVELAVPAMA